MSFDLYTVYPCETTNDIRRIVGNHRDAYKELKCIYTKISLLTPALTGREGNYAKSGHYRYGGGYQSLVHKRGREDNQYTSELIQPALKQLFALDMYLPKPEMKVLPDYSFFIQFPFVLSKAYVSKGDEVIYIHENPLVKDYTFKVPMVRPSSWKGNLRHAAEKLSEESQESNRDSSQYLTSDEDQKSNRDSSQNIDRRTPSGDEDRKQIIRLFGTAKDETDEFLSEDEGGRRGRLLFYPTFFDKIDLDVINPHSRETKAGTVPIVMEIAPSGATGYFSLMYVPFDLIGESDEDRVKSEVKSDLLCVHSAISGMTCRFGFSAKRSRGYGLIKDELVVKDESGRKIAEGIFQATLADFSPQNFDSFDSLKQIIDKFVDNL